MFCQICPKWKVLRLEWHIWKHLSERFGNISDLFRCTWLKSEKHIIKEHLIFSHGTEAGPYLNGHCHMLMEFMQLMPS